MRKLISVAILAATTMLVSPASAAEKLGKGDYFVFASGDMNDTMDLDQQAPPAVITTEDFDRLARLDDLCRVQSKTLKPSAFKSVFLYTLRNSIPGAAGLAGGAAAGGFAKGGAAILNYGLYGLGASIGASIGGGINAYEMGKHGMVAGCMMGLLNEAKRLNYLRNITIAYNPFPVNGHAIKRSGLSASAVDAQPRNRAVAVADNGTEDQSEIIAPPAP